MRVQVCTVIAVAALALGLPAPATAGVVFVVNTTSNAADGSPGDGICGIAGGGCSLRAAIQEANAAPGLDTIQFAIGSGTQRITVSSALPTISSPVIIDGWTQPGYSGTPIVELRGGSGAGLTITAGSSTVRGLVINGFSGVAVVLNSSNNVVEGNYIGTDVSGGVMITIGGCGIEINSSNGNRIGGTTLPQRNIVSGSTKKGNDGGICVTGGGSNVIQGNFIGTDVTGMLDFGNQGRGIAITGSSDNIVGGPAAGAGNLISGNRATGVRMLGGSNNNLVQGNFIGVNRTLDNFIKNDRGVQIRGGNNNQVIGNVIAGQVYDGVLIWEGATNSLVSGNIIAFNGQGPIGDPSEANFVGVSVHTGSGHRIVGNSIHSNTLLGIDLGSLGLSLNDPGDGDSGPNNLQNFPVLTSASTTASTSNIVGTLNSIANQQYLVQFFSNPACDSSGYGEGRFMLGELQVTTDAGGNAAFNAAFPFALPVGWAATATATDQGGNTSEFSICTTIQ